MTVGGGLVSTISEVPKNKELFKYLRKEIWESDYREKFYHCAYYIGGKDNYIKDFIYVSEYYKSAFDAIEEKLYTLNMSVTQINFLLNSINDLYSKGGTYKETGQSFFHLEQEIYILKGHISTFIFISRSVLDSLSTLISFLSGGTCQFNSFSDYIKYLKKMKKEDNKFCDLEILEYIEEKMWWFEILRDIRDYMTHIGFINIDFYKNEQGILKLYISNLYKYNKDSVTLLQESYNGIYDFTTFFDLYFSNKIKKYL